MSYKYSFIIPTLNEALYLENTLQSLSEFDNYEIIISDGGSKDDTLKIAKRFNAKIVSSQAGRGIQLNNGIKSSSGEILCFLHADTFLPENASKVVEEYFQNGTNMICRFKLGFDVEHSLLNGYKLFSKYDTMFTRFGDMFIAARRDFVYEIGAFPNWKIFEDVAFLNNASKKSKIFVLDGEVISSARTFTKHGLISQQLFNFSSFVKYIVGVRQFIENAKYYNRKMKGIDASIILFVKYPEDGKVKTRLAETIGNKKAVRIYSLLAKNVVENIQRLKSTYKYIFYSEESEKEKIKNWIKGSFFYASQKGNGLGERMSNAFRVVFGHGAKKALIVGTDIPDLSTEIIEEAIRKLDQYDVVIGPSPDGGYYLLGMKKFYKGLFENIQYSTDSVFNDTIGKIKNENLTFDVIESSEDIDTEHELKNWLKSSQNEKLKKKISKIYCS